MAFLRIDFPACKGCQKIRPSAKAVVNLGFADPNTAGDRAHCDRRYSVANGDLPSGIEQLLPPGFRRHSRAGAGRLARLAAPQGECVAQAKRCRGQRGLGIACFDASGPV